MGAATPQSPPPVQGAPPSAAGISIDSIRNTLLAQIAKSLAGIVSIFSPAAADTILGNATGSTAQPIPLPQASVFAILFGSKTVTSNYAVGVGDYHIRGNGTITITLPAKTSLSRVLWVTNVNAADTVTISSADSTINGSSTLALTTQWKNALLICTDAQTWDALVA